MNTPTRSRSVTATATATVAPRTARRPRTVTRVLVVLTTLTVVAGGVFSVSHLTSPRGRQVARTVAATSPGEGAGPTTTAAPPRLTVAPGQDGSDEAAPAPGPSAADRALEEAAALESLGTPDLQSEIATIDGDLDRRKAIERLNRNQVDSDERAELGRMLQRTTLLKHELARRELRKFRDQVDAYALTHQERVNRHLAGVAR